MSMHARGRKVETEIVKPTMTPAKLRLAMAARSDEDSDLCRDLGILELCRLRARCENRRWHRRTYSLLLACSLCLAPVRVDQSL